MNHMIWFILSISLSALPVQARANTFSDFFSGALGAPASISAPAKTPRQPGPDGSRLRHYALHRPGALMGGFAALASWYGGGPRSLEPNTHTASGERFDRFGLTAAHRTLPLGTRLLVSYRGKSCVVRVNDRGPAAWTGRSLDLSRGAAARLGLIQSGTGRVSVTILPHAG